MDLLTLTISTVMFSAMTAAALVSLYITNKTNKAMCDWAIAGVLFFSCNLSILISTFFTLPWLLSPVLSNVMYIAAHGFIFSGIVRHTRNENAYLTIAIICAMVFLIQFAPHVSESVTFRLLTILPMMMALNGLSLFHLWRFRNSSLGKGYWAAGCALSLFIVYTLVHMGMVLSYPEKLEYLGDDIVQTTNLLATTLYDAGITLGVIFIHAWHRETTLRNLSRTDALSGWYNRHALNEFATREFACCQRDKTTFAFVTFDIDYFKKVNDTYGHLIGDHALKHIASVAKNATREYDYHFRHGGEEFVLMFSGLQINDIEVVAERVRRAIHAAPFVTPTDTIPLSISLGIAAMEPDDLNWHVVLERADNAMYRAKKGGRNKAERFNHQKLALVKA